jgi:hypothetical protein
MIRHTCTFDDHGADSDCKACQNMGISVDPISGYVETLIVAKPEFDDVNKPKHYNSHPSGVECIELTRHMTFDPGNSFKYVFRTELKNGKQDLEKSIYYLRDAIANPNPIYLPSWTDEEEHKLDRVIQAETNSRKLFFVAFKELDLYRAHAMVSNMLEVFNGA